MLSQQTEIKDNLKNLTFGVFTLTSIFIALLYYIQWKIH